LTKGASLDDKQEIVPLEPVLANAKRSKKSAAKKPIVPVRNVPLEGVLARAEPLK